MLREPWSIADFTALVGLENELLCANNQIDGSLNFYFLHYNSQELMESFDMVVY